jgi:hypothetical protein
MSNVLFFDPDNGLDVVASVIMRRLELGNQPSTYRLSGIVATLMKHDD